MNRRIFISDQLVSLAEYIPEEDDLDCYTCWLDSAVQDGYNYQMRDTFEEFCKRPVRSRLLAVIVRNEDSRPMGIVSLSPEGSPPDLSIMLYPAYRGNGYGTNAFALAASHCFDLFGMDCIYAGCYENNLVSQKMLKACGFAPNPEGDAHETHYLTRAPIIQRDYMLNRKKN